MSRKTSLLSAFSLLTLALLACSLIPSSTQTSDGTDTSSSSQSDISADFGLGTQAQIAQYYQGSTIFYLEDFADESYSGDEYNTPGTLVFTVNDPGSSDVLVESSWCNDSLELALDDWQYMQNTFTINGQQVAAQNVFFDQWEPEDGGGCVSDSILITEWPSGSHTVELQIHQTQDLGDVPTGDYIWRYDVTTP